MTKYKKYAMPIEAWNNFKLKQNNMNQTIKNLTGKTKKIPLSRLLVAVSRKPIYFDDGEIVGLSSRRNKKSKGFTGRMV